MKQKRPSKDALDGRSIQRTLGQELHDLLFHVPRSRGGDTGGHLYQNWHDRAHDRQGERLPVVVKIEQTMSIMYSLGMDKEVLRQVKAWNTIYAPDPIMNKTSRIILEEFHHVETPKKQQTANRRLKKQVIAAASAASSDAALIIHNTLVVQLNDAAGDPAPERYRRDGDRVYLDHPDHIGTNIAAPDSDQSGESGTIRPK